MVRSFLQSKSGHLNGMAISAGILLMIMAVGCRPSSPETIYDTSKQVFADSAGLATAHPLASDIGLAVLKKGGNAVDAAIAVQFALAVCYPNAGNIGGGGFLLFREADGSVHALDFREKAPALAYETMFQDSTGEVVVDLSTLGYLAAGVPGTVDGMVAAFERFSRLKDWKALVQPAIDLAQNGFIITRREADGLNKYASKFISVNGEDCIFTKKGGWKEGDRLTQPQLAATLEKIRDSGRAGFYEGSVADALAKAMKENGGLITKEDLANYSAVWRTPIRTNYRGYTVHSMPPPSSGGIALVQLLESVERYALGEMGFHRPETVHLMAEAERWVYADRAAHLGDSDFYPVPMTELLDSAYIAERMAGFSPDRASASSMVEGGDFGESEETTHFSVLDAFGNAVSLTTTLNTSYGSKAVVSELGFLLNNEMDDFSAKPGVPNFYGLVGSAANRIEPGKRMLSSMTPTIVEKDGGVFLIVGTPGGSTIITSVFQVIVNIIDFDMNAKAAVEAPRFHHQWLPDTLKMEKQGLPAAVVAALQQKGHILAERESIGRVEAILVRDGKIEIAADIRGDDTARGY